MGNILAVTEVRDSQLKKSSLELVSEAVRLGKKLNVEVHALVTSESNADGIAEQIKSYGVGKVYTVENESLKSTYLTPYKAIVLAAIEKSGADHILFSASTQGKILSAFVAAAKEVSAFSDCTQIDVEGDKLSIQKPVYAGKVISTLTPTQTPVIASLRPNVFPAEESGAHEGFATEKLDVAVSDNRVRVKATKAPEGKKIELTEAGAIVSGGRGMKGPEHFGLIEELADELGAAVGASRAVVDAGWRPPEQQVGQTGKTVSPQLYIACGISGAIQHLAGMRTSKVIVAINKDPEAPIFQVADYGIVGDVFEVLPKMKEAAQASKS